MSNKTVTLEQLLESARKSEALSVQVAQAAQVEIEKRPTQKEIGTIITNIVKEQMNQQTASVGKSMAGQSVQPTRDTTVTAAEGAEIFNDYRDRTYSTYVDSGDVACGKYSHAEGSCTTASGESSHAEGYSTIASGMRTHAEGHGALAAGAYSHAEGANTEVQGDLSHVEGHKTTITKLGSCSHAEGYGTTVEGSYSHAEGYNTTVKANYSHAEGCDTMIETGAPYSHVEGLGTVAHSARQHVCGSYNVEYGVSVINGTQILSRFIVGKGSSDTSRANCFRVTDTGTYAAGAYNASGADYAELFEWADGNRSGEDRAGRFVTLTGDKLSLAGPGDDYILGIVSGNPSIVGDVHDDQWAGMYLYDVFGRPLWEDVEVPAETAEVPDPEHPGQTVTRVILPARTEHRQKINPAYDGSTPYTARTERPEWDAVGLMGKLVAVDDGTCQADGYCTVAEGGIATESRERTRYRVMKRLDETHVQVMVLP